MSQVPDADTATPAPAAKVNGAAPTAGAATPPPPAEPLPAAHHGHPAATGTNGTSAAADDGRLRSPEPELAGTTDPAAATDGPATATDSSRSDSSGSTESAGATGATDSAGSSESPATTGTTGTTESARGTEGLDSTNQSPSPEAGADTTPPPAGGSETTPAPDQAAPSGFRLVAAIALGAGLATLGGWILGEYPFTGIMPYVAGVLFALVVTEVILSVSYRQGKITAVAAAVCTVGGLGLGVWISTGRGIDPIPIGGWVAVVIGAAVALWRGGIRAAGPPRASSPPSS